MLLILGLDTQFGMLEGVMTPMLDAKLFPNIRVEVKTGIIIAINSKSGTKSQFCLIIILLLIEA